MGDKEFIFIFTNSVAYVYINPKVVQLLIEKYTTYSPEWHKKPFYKNDKYVYKTRNNLA